MGTVGGGGEGREHGKNKCASIYNNYANNTLTIECTEGAYEPITSIILIEFREKCSFKFKVEFVFVS